MHPGLQRSRCWTLPAAEDAGKIELGIGFRGISGPRDLKKEFQGIFLCCLLLTCFGCKAGVRFYTICFICRDLGF